MKTIGQKTILAILLLMFVSINAIGQNVELHYDFGKKGLTSTVEMFRSDKVGSTYFFIDMEFTPKVSGAYGEIARELCFWQNSKLDWLSLHVEYNGGLDTVVGSYNNAWLAGLTYSGHSKDWSKTWSLPALYKLIPGATGFKGEAQVHNFQITAVWNLDFFNRWLSFNGYADFWREIRDKQNTEFMFITEPQLWVNLNKIKGMENVNLSLGTEVELSANFVDKGFYVIPTLAIKYAF